MCKILILQVEVQRGKADSQRPLCFSLCLWLEKRVIIRTLPTPDNLLEKAETLQSTMCHIPGIRLLATYPKVSENWISKLALAGATHLFWNVALKMQNDAEQFRQSWSGGEAVEPPFCTGLLGAEPCWVFLSRLPLQGTITSLELTLSGSLVIFVQGQKCGGLGHVLPFRAWKQWKNLLHCTTTADEIKSRSSLRPGWQLWKSVVVFFCHNLKPWEVLHLWKKMENKNKENQNMKVHAKGNKHGSYVSYCFVCSITVFHVVQVG